MARLVKTTVVFSLIYVSDVTGIPPAQLKYILSADRATKIPWENVSSLIGTLTDEAQRLRFSCGNVLGSSDSVDDENFVGALSCGGIDDAVLVAGLVGHIIWNAKKVS